MAEKRSKPEEMVDPKVLKALEDLDRRMREGADRIEDVIRRADEVRRRQGKDAPSERR